MGRGDRGRGDVGGGSGRREGDEPDVRADATTCQGDPAFDADEFADLDGVCIDTSADTVVLGFRHVDRNPLDIWDDAAIEFAMIDLDYDGDGRTEASVIVTYDEAVLWVDADRDDRVEDAEILCDGQLDGDDHAVLAVFGRSCFTTGALSASAYKHYAGAEDITAWTAMTPIPGRAGSQPGTAPSGFSASLYRLYRAYFLREPDQGGMSYWLGSGLPLAVISEQFARSPEFVGRYGPLGSGDFVKLVYRNVLGREPDAAGYAHWAPLVESGRISRGTMMIGFSESAEYKAITGTR